jgi:hypothetical protein
MTHLVIDYYFEQSRELGLTNLVRYNEYHSRYETLYRFIFVLPLN